MTEQEQLTEAYQKRFQFLYGYDPAKGGQQTETKVVYKNKLSEIKGNDKTVFTHTVLQEMREGKFDEKHLIFEALPSVKTLLLLDEEFQRFSEFMQSLRTDADALKSPDNAIRKVFQGFVSGKQQEWHLIEPEDYHMALRQYSYNTPQSEAYDSYWAPKIMEWVEMAKLNVQQFVANSYLCSGPTLEQDSENNKGQNLMALMWFNLTRDKSISYKPHECGKDSEKERAFFDKYWRPFTKYIKTRYGEGSETFESDSPLDGFFNLIAEFDANKGDFKQWLVTLNKLIDLCHNRGSLAHLFIRGGNEACARISNN
jgi:hypothetical protein